jgi:exopolysaccharide biosynthesis protein
MKTTPINPEKTSPPAPKRNKTGLVRGLLAFFVALSGILYLLADRYLIEHVEISNANAYAATAVATSMPTAVPTASANPAVTPVALTSTSAAPVATDDWHYLSAGVSITVTKVTAGNTKSPVTYFVAEVALSEATQLTSAFAKNSFGRNIIEYTSQIAQNNGAIFAINGDYYGFRTDGIEIRNGVIYRDAPARTGLAFYRDGTMQIYDETQTSAQALLEAGVWNTLSFGPALIQDSVVAANLNYVEVDTNFGNHSIQGSNPRTGIGLIDNNHFVFVVVDGRSGSYSRGVTLTEFAQIFKDLGCREAYNIDGGGSSTMYFMGRVVNNPLGKNQERGTSDILFIVASKPS